MVNNLTDDLTILTLGKADFEPEQISKLNEHGIKVIEKEISELQHDSGYLKTLVFEDGSKEDFDATYAVVPFKQHSNMPSLLGCKLNELGYIEVDMMQKTTIDGVFAVGDNSSRMRSVSNAVATGNIAGAAVNMELVQEQF